MEEKVISENNITQEFYKTTEKFHVITCWVGIVLNLIWFISDYLVIKDYWVPFFIFRLSVSLISTLILVLRKPLNINIYFCMFILVLGIAIQNAYMWSVMDLINFQKHTFAYMVLFIGVGMLVLWDLKFSIIILIATIISNLIFYSINSKLSIEEFLINGGLLTATVAVFCVFMIRTRYRLTINEIKSRLALEYSKSLIEEKQKEIIDSINYGKRIQMALLANDKLLEEHLPEYFVLFKPKDIVAGDFYWATPTNDGFIYVTADCTGHGVPGAFMSILNTGLLSEVIKEKGITQPHEIFNQLRTRLIEVVSRDGQKDGMDAVLCKLDVANLSLEYAAANNAFYIIRNNQLIIHKADKMPVGIGHDDSISFTYHKIDLHKNDVIYTFTDGYADQFGGVNGKKFKYKQMEDLMVSIAGLPMNEQKDIFDKRFEEWKGNLEQVDDVLIIGVRV